MYNTKYEAVEKTNGKQKLRYAIEIMLKKGEAISTMFIY